jgi:Trp operon repressor
MARGPIFGNHGRDRVLEHLPTRSEVTKQRRRYAARVILRALHDAGMTQTQIADALGTSQNVISRWACGLTTASAAWLACLVKLANERSVTLPDLDWRPPALDELPLDIPAGGA